MKQIQKYKFNPHDWLSNNIDTKRLSTCFGKFKEEPFNLNFKILIGYFLKTCPYRVYLNQSSLQDLLTINQFIRRDWLDQNCKGYWYDLSENEIDNRKKINIRKVFIFQYNDDAIHFKLVWG
jgi:hypothetical protein